MQPSADSTDPAVITKRPPRRSISRPTQAEDSPIASSAAEKPPCTRVWLQPVSAMIRGPKPPIR